MGLCQVASERWAVQHSGSPCPKDRWFLLSLTVQWGQQCITLATGETEWVGGGWTPAASLYVQGEPWSPP